jgi:hypothetical protein
VRDDGPPADDHVARARLAWASGAARANHLTLGRAASGPGERIRLGVESAARDGGGPSEAGSRPWNFGMERRAGLLASRARAQPGRSLTPLARSGWSSQPAGSRRLFRCLRHTSSEAS